VPDRRRKRTRPTSNERGAAPAPRAARGETHEPAVPKNWPEGHVSVALTGDDTEECIAITIHDVKHHLHSTTAYELRDMLVDRLDEWQTMAADEGNGIDPYTKLVPESGS
jgi:hypothetical protein